MTKEKKSIIGERNCNFYGTEMLVIEDNGWDNIIIEFQDVYKTKVKTTRRLFKDGYVKNPYEKILYDIGYLGEGKYGSKTHKNIYQVWCNMLMRCYEPYTINKQLSYIDCYVCEEWHCFQNFAKWFEENYYECDNERLEIDKDILCKNNKIYSPKTCILAPMRINQLFVKQYRKRGDLPIGVSLINNNGYKYLMGQCSKIDCKGKRINAKKLFPLNKPFQAFFYYKTTKENYIKQIADEYKDLIPQRLYDALYTYEIEIND